MNGSPSYQFLARASGFLEAARVVVDAKGNKSSLRAPVAHLIAHALEVMMKHVLLVKGDDLEEIRKKFGHDIWALWKHGSMGKFRQSAYEQAETVWGIARDSNQYKDDFSQKPICVLNRYLIKLSYLHTGKSKYALKYVSSSTAEVPKPLLLLDTFQPIKEELLRAYSREFNN